MVKGVMNKSNNILNNKIKYLKGKKLKGKAKKIYTF